MIVLAILTLVPLSIWMWQRFLIGALFFGHKYFVMYLAYMGMWAYLVSHSSTLGPILLTLIGIQVSVVALLKVIRYA